MRYDDDVGIALAIVVGHDLSANDVHRFPDRVFASAQMRDAAEALWHTMQPRWPKLDPLADFMAWVPNPNTATDIEAAWRRTSADAKTVVAYDWAGFSLVIGRHAVFATHLERLSAFVVDIDGIRSRLRACAHALATELGSPLIAYGPDSALPFEQTFEAVLDGQDIDGTMRRAAELCGEPAREIDGMIVDGEQRGYFVEVVDR